jgi:large subunit ribosomal protein L21
MPSSVAKSMYAILETGGKQYKVHAGDILQVEKLSAEAGDTVELDRVLMIAGDDDKVAVGTPVLEGAKVLAEVVGQGRGPKIIVFKYKAKVRYRRKTGHRQALTTLRIKEIQGVTNDGT